MLDAFQPVGILGRMNSGFLRKLQRVAFTLGLACAALSLRAADKPSAPELQVADQFYLAIPKDAFGKDYLFSASMIPQGESPTSHGLASKIVRFELFPDGVDMYESTKGLVVTEDLPARRLLATFPIVRQEDDRVVVDFNKGMRRVFTQSWTDGGPLDFESHDDVLEVPDSRVFEMRADGGQLIIRQSVQARSREQNADVEARYRSPLFHRALAAGKFRGQGAGHGGLALHQIFSRRKARLKRARAGMSSRIDRFDLKQPVVFYYSANTPPELCRGRQGRHSLLEHRFWQRSRAGEESARTASPRRTRNTTSCNGCRGTSAGFAYADVLADPLNGESQARPGLYDQRVQLLRQGAGAGAVARDGGNRRGEKRRQERRGAHSACRFSSRRPCCEMDPREFAAADGARLAGTAGER